MSVFAKKFHYPPIKLKRDPIIIDFGANIGLSILSLHYLYPESKIIGFEMDKSNYNIACMNTQQLGDSCIVINKAIWINDGSIKYGGQDEQSFSINNGDIMAESISIPTLIQKFNLKRIDYIKMDIEGSEMDIFQNNLDWLTHVYSINLEIHNSSMINWYISKLKENGFNAKPHKGHWSGVIGYK